jgi:hypothetical protein
MTTSCDADAIREGYLLCFIVELQRLHPAPPGMRLRPGFVWLAQAVPEKIFHQPMLGTTFIGLGSGALANQIAQSFPYLRQIGQLDCLSAINSLFADSQSCTSDP